MFHGWMFDPDGDQAAADSTRSSTSLDTGASLNARTDRRLWTASYTSIIACLSPAIVMPVMKHSGTNATSLGAHRWDMARHRTCSKWGHPREGTCALPRDPSSQLDHRTERGAQRWQTALDLVSWVKPFHDSRVLMSVIGRYC